MNNVQNNNDYERRKTNSHRNGYRKNEISQMDKKPSEKQKKRRREKMRIQIDEDKLNKIVEALEGCDGCERVREAKRRLLQMLKQQTDAGAQRLTPQSPAQNVNRLVAEALKKATPMKSGAGFWAFADSCGQLAQLVAAKGRLKATVDGKVWTIHRYGEMGKFLAFWPSSQG